MRELRKQRAGENNDENVAQEQEADLAERVPRHLGHNHGSQEETGNHPRVHHHMGRRPPNGENHRFSRPDLFFRADDY